MTDKKKYPSLGPVPVESGLETASRMALLLWGPATCGKSTFAATAPGVKLWLSFGDNEHVSVSNRADVIVADVSKLGHAELFKHAKSENPFGLDQFFGDHEEVETLVVDSATAIEYKALQKAVADGIGAGRGFTPTMEAPGISAYGGRNAILIETLTGLLRVTAKHNVNIIITAHEGDPIMVKQPNGAEMIDYYTIMLGGKLVNNTTWRLSEIWFMSQESTGERDRKIAIRPTRKRRPMKSRMFTMSGPDAEFTVTYDSDKPDDGQMTIASFFYEWLDGGKVRLQVPKGKKK